jgi:hypothetical protein
MLILATDELTEAEDVAISTMLEQIYAAITDRRTRIDRNTIISDAKNLSVSDYFAAQPFYLDYYTYKGEDIVGAQPFGLI